MFYTYVWLREDGSPYYVGKGKGNRAFQSKMHKAECPPRERIVIYPADSEQDAFETEIALVWYYGRKDLGTGILRNLTDGGDGAAHSVTEETRRKISETSKGKTFSEERKRRISEGLKGNKNCSGRKFKHSEESRAKIRTARMLQSSESLSHKHSEESKAKIRVARARQVSPMKGRKQTEAAKQKMSDTKWQKRHVFIL